MGRTAAKSEARATTRLLREYHELGDARARERLVEMHLPLVEGLARQHSRHRDEHDDLVGAGSIGLLKAIDGFRRDRGRDFTAYAVPTIAGEMKRHLRDRSSPVRVPRRLQEARTRVHRAEAELGAELRRAPTAAELARDLGMDEADVAAALASWRAGDPVPLRDSAGAEARDEQSASHERLLLADALGSLGEEDRELVYRRIVAGAANAEIARELGLSPRQVSRRVERALAALRTQLGAGRENALPASADAPTMAEMIGSTEQQDRVRHLLELPYHIVLVQDDDESGWTARVEELPGCEARGASSDEAARAIRESMREWIEAALAKGSEVPAPRRQSTHSGRLLLRMPQGLHSELARRAELEDVSLNGFITGLLAGAIGWQRPGDERAGGGEDSSAGPDDPSGRGPQASADRSRRLLGIAMVANLVIVALAALVAIALLVYAWQSA
jgi:RNA polymerase sigma-B factor